MIPYKDDNPTERRPYVTVALIVINVLVFFYELSLGPRLEGFLNEFGAIPAGIFSGTDLAGPPALPVPVTLLTSLFLHGGWMHLIGNMLYLWIFGNNIEDILGRFRFILFYLAGGVVATLAQGITSPASTIPTIGASGAISGVLGAYLIIFPRARVYTLLPIGFFLQVVVLPAYFVLGFWFVLQFFSGVFSLGSQHGGVAFFAHVGGFIFGMLLIKFVIKYPPRRSAVNHQGYIYRLRR